MAGENINTPQEGNDILSEFDLSTLDLSGTGAEVVEEVEEVEETEELEETEESTEETEEETTEEEESEETDEEAEETEETEEPSPKDIKEPSPFTPYAKLVKGEGILPNFDIDNWDGKPEGLIAAMKDEISLGIEEYKSGFNPRIKRLVDNYEEGVPLENLLELDKQVFNLSQIKPEEIKTDVNTQKEVARQYFKETTRFNDEAIDKMINRLDVAGELGNESETFYEELKTIYNQKEEAFKEQAKAQRAANEQQRVQQLAAFKKQLNELEEIVPGVKLNTNIREKMYKGMTVPVALDNNNVPVNEIQKAFMENPQLETTLAYIWYATNGFKDFKVFGSSGKKTAMKEFEEAITGSQTSKSGKGKKKTIKQADTSELIQSMMDISNMK